MVNTQDLVGLYQLLRPPRKKFLGLPPPKSDYVICARPLMEMMIFVTDGGFQQTRPVMEVMIFLSLTGNPSDLLDV